MADADDDDASLPREQQAYWRHRRWTSRALAVFGLAAAVRIVFSEPRVWGDGRAATALVTAAGVALSLAGLVAYVHNARMAERRGFIRGRFRRGPTDGEPPA